MDSSTGNVYNVAVDDKGNKRLYDPRTGEEVILYSGEKPNKEYVDENGNKVDVKYINSDDLVTTTETVVENWQTNQTARLNGVGSQDRDDIHDEYMHHTHITQTTGAGERGEYMPGKTVSLANNVYLDTIINKTGNILGNNNKNTFSKLDYIATYAATGQYSVQDLWLTVNALEQNGVTFAKHPEHYFKGTVFETIYNDVKDKAGAYAQTADEIRARVEQLKVAFQQVHDQMTEWSGSANKTARAAIQCILGKFEVTMGNIEMALEPSCEAVDKFAEILERLKSEEENFLEPLEEELKVLLAKRISQTITEEYIPVIT